MDQMGFLEEMAGTRYDAYSKEIDYLRLKQALRNRKTSSSAKWARVVKQLLTVMGFKL